MPDAPRRDIQVLRQNPVAGAIKGRALTDILKSIGEEVIEFVDEEGRVLGEIQKKEAMARIVWEAALKGRVVTVNGGEKSLGARDVMDLIKWLYAHIDGPPKQEVSITDENDGVTFELTSGGAERIREILDAARARGDQGSAVSSTPTAPNIQLLAERRNTNI